VAFPFTPLKSKEVKELLGLIEGQWGCTPDWSPWAVFRSAKDNLYLASRDVGRLPLDQLRVTAIGCYIGELKHGELRPSIEGSQLIGPRATKNVADLDAGEAEAWMKGLDLEKQGPWTGFVIVRHGKDCLGSGKYKDGKLLNFVPKTRRLTELAMALAEESDEHTAEEA
jgi:NOL1/NOP2/fmu family ribosome biogenesis protein